MLKSLPKILIIFFLLIFIFQLACLLFLTLAPSVSQAADPATFKPQVQIPGMEQEFGATDKTGGYAIPGSTASIAKYVRLIYKYAIGIVGILAAVVLMIGGVMWIVAGGSATAIGEAKSWIGASLTGLIIALASYLILATINPALVDFKTTEISKVKGGSCCYSYYPGSTTSVKCDALPQEQCQGRTWVGYDCAQVSYCQNVPGAVTRNGCCQNMCTAATTETTCEQDGGNWLVGTYTCSTADPSRCVAADINKGCCMFSSNSMDPTKTLCDNRATEAECKSTYENKPGFTYKGFDNYKVCQAGAGLVSSRCVRK